MDESWWFGCEDPWPMFRFMAAGHLYSCRHCGGLWEDRGGSYSFLPGQKLQSCCDNRQLETNGEMLVPGRFASKRKLRLLACALCRQVPSLLGQKGDPGRRAVGVAEWYADGGCRDKRQCPWYPDLVLTDLGYLQKAQRDAGVDAWYYSPPWWPFYAASEDIRRGVGDILGSKPFAREAFPPAFAASLFRCVFGNPFKTLPRLTRKTWECKVCCARPNEEGEVEHGRGCYMLSEDGGGSEWIEEDSPLAAWLSWRGGLIPTMAESIYQERRWEEMPALADALEESGCQEENLLRHLRGWRRCAPCPTIDDISEYKGEWVQGKGAWKNFSGPKGPLEHLCKHCGGSGWRKTDAPHARGCFVLDLLTGRS